MSNSYVPKIRFNGFHEDWEQRKLRDISKNALGGGTPKTSEKEYWDGTIPWFQSADFVEHEVQVISPKKWISETGLKKSAAQLVPANSIAIVTRVGVGKLAFIPFSYTTSQDILSLSELNIDEKFGCYDIYKLLQKEKNLTQGTSIKGITKNVLLNKTINVPCHKEQEKIGTYFLNLDHLITLHQRKCDEMKKLKKYMLQNMFPQEGEVVPKIRFKGFTEDWEQRKFGELAEYKKGPFGSSIKKDMFIPKGSTAIKVYEQQNAINKDWSLERYFLPKSYVIDKLKSFEVHGGDIIVSCAGTIGEIYEIPNNAEHGVINQALMRIRVNDDLVDKRMFIILFSNMIENFTATHSNGSAIKNIPPFADLKPMKTLIPLVDEQERISSYFEQLDHLITLHQRKCEKLQKLKKYMLQNMFVE